MINFKTKPHRAVSYNEKAIIKAAEQAGSLIAEIKYDGVRGNLVVDGKAEGCWSEFCTRVGTEVPALSYLSGTQSTRWEALINDDENPFPQGVMIDGELMIKGLSFQESCGLLRTKWLKPKNTEYHMGDEKPTKGLTKAFKLNPSKLTMVVYDLIPLDTIKTSCDYDVPTVIRVEHAKLFVKLLRKHFPEVDWQSPQSWDVYDIESLHELYNKVRDDGHEGLVVKDPFAPYRRGKKTGMWKMKPDDDIDGVIVGLVWGTEGKANEGKVIGFEVLLDNPELSDNLTVVNACGLSKEQMEEYTERYLSLNQGRTSEDALNPYMLHQCQVKYMEVTPDGSLRHPSFHSFRGTEDQPTLKV